MAARRVVIIGGGFGGIKVALKLAHDKDFKVTLISDKTHFEYHAALYRSATGWSPREVVVPLKDIFDSSSDVEVVQDVISKIDSKNKLIYGENSEKYHFDDLVIAVGQNINYFGIAGMEENSYGLNTIKDAIELRQHLRDVISEDGSKRKKEFIVIGGGATGVELASELKSFISELSKLEGKEPPKLKVTLIQGTPRLLSLLSPKASIYAQRRLEQLGVDVMLSTLVTGLEGNLLSVGENKLTADTVAWTAGATNNTLFKENESVFTLARNSKVEVDEYLSVGHDIYVIGDNANTQFSGMAQTALYDGHFVAKNLIRKHRKKELKLYVPHRPIYAIPIGHNYAVIQWGGAVLRGRPAWILRRIADLRLFVTFEPYRKAIKSWRSGNKRARGYEIE